ncbi:MULTISPECIES: substrate-binding periplasmic protein [unclassified Colwellia]|uniref:substrate-binding periplasmic protein n=1 Tax=unclassified Colwellia TaxID=196834 RepID=UPI0015F3C526|nr:MULTISPECIES: transporter substrate-binding domain-containing protein [unclassified Colwellia]MBA6231735.1 amino acid ABC transporter substrate-binding protein [Colwellia sp. MB02u-7]MBA6235599.1 amino acid ABC transporter substrate-binding protein [Colwellia sp. MB02u-11]MBA6254888.1 amino acid ABC transporter substrate-binding protein [Colwellia sp. MB3u-28]MBA6259670.1 amino acid ABC transporter substrate-binding protein [Colwellia sp. MB3u-41]MBA6299587.1 amino acid ABC transporter subs
MKKYLIFALVLTFHGSANEAPSRDYAVGWELWYPYQYHNKQQELVGLDFDIFNAIIKESTLKVTFTEIPWKRHLQYIKTGKIDMAMGASHSAEREQTAYFSIPYRLEKVNLFVKKGTAQKIKLKKLSDLSSADYMIGVEGGYYYGKEYQKLITTKAFHAHINNVIDLEQNVALLLKGHIDGVLVDPVTMKAFSEKYSLQGEFEIHPLEIYQDTIHIMLSRQSCTIETLNRINDAITTLVQNGEIAKIIAHWTAIHK